LAPGFRVGYVLAPPAIRDKLVLAQESALLCPSSFTQIMISEYLPNVETTTPDGGFYLWLTLPEGIDSKAMLPLAVKELVAYTPGTAFFGDGTGQRNLRICYSYPTPENIKIGIKRLSNVINLQTDLLQTFSH